MNKLPKDYIVYAETIEEAEEITQHQKLLFRENNSKQKQTWYRFEPKDIFDRFGHSGDSRWYPSSKPHLPIYTFKKWKELMTETVSSPFKYTIEYCKNNKVAIKLDNYTQLKEVNTLFKNDRIPNVKYFPIEQRFNSKGCNWSYVSDNYYKPESYEIIEFEQLNLKIQENMKKKIIAYIVTKEFPSIEGLYKKGERITLSNSIFKYASSYPEWLSPVYEEEFKEGDIVTDDEGRNIYTYSHESNGQHYANGGGPCSFGKDLRKATAEEIKAFKEKIKINGYDCIKTKAGVEFGCQKFSKEELATISRLISSPIDAQITISGTKITEELLNKIMN